MKIKSLIFAVLFLFLLIPSSRLQAKSKSDFIIKDGILIQYTGKAKTVTIPSNVHTIGYESFAKSDIQKVIIPKTVKEIEVRAFWMCKNLKSVEWQEGTKKIGLQAFSNCTNLSKIKLPSSLVDIGGYVLEKTKWTEDRRNKEFAINNHILIEYNGRKSKVTIPSSIKIISGYVFYRKELQDIIEEVVISEGVEHINEYAFYYCTQIKSVSLPSGIKSIGRAAFYNCYQLESIVFPNSLTEIGQSSFCKTDLRSVSIPKKVKYIGASAFADCNRLYEVNLNSTKTLINGNSFKNTPWVNALEYVDGYLIINSTIVDYTGEDKKIVIPESIKIIGLYAFSDNEHIESVVIPSTVQEINHGAFRNCINLKKVKIEDGVKVIDPHVFSGTGITNITIPGTVATFHFESFNSCKDLKKIYINEGVTRLSGAFIFYGSDKIRDIYVPKSIKYVPDTYTYQEKNPNITFHCYNNKLKDLVSNIKEYKINILKR